MTLIEGISILLNGVYMLAFIYGILLIIEAAWKLKSGQISESLTGVFSALFLAMGPSMLRFLFFVFGLPGGFDL